MKAYFVAPLGLALSFAAGCGDDPEPETAYNAQGNYGQYQGGYQYPTATATTPAPAPAPAPTATATTPSALPQVPIPCHSDENCGTHRCNTETQNCIVPCATSADCIPGNNCTMGLCVPGSGMTQ